MTDEQRDHEHADGWQLWSKFVLKALERFEERADAIEERLRKIEQEQAILKTKLALYVAAGTAVVVVAAEIARILLKSS
jgi:hypothetical protein